MSEWTARYDEWDHLIVKSPDGWEWKFYYVPEKVRDKFLASKDKRKYMEKVLKKPKYWMNAQWMRKGG